MRAVVAGWALVLIALLMPVRTAEATTSLYFSVDGYALDIEVGHLDVAVLGSLRVIIPSGETPGGVRVRVANGLEIVKFDTERKVIILRYDGSDRRVPPFRFEARGKFAVLHIDGKDRRAPFNWMM